MRPVNISSKHLRDGQSFYHTHYLPFLWGGGTQIALLMYFFCDNSLINVVFLHKMCKAVLKSKSDQFSTELKVHRVIRLTKSTSHQVQNYVKKINIKLTLSPVSV